MSALYKEGTVIITMAYNKDKIKVSSRICGRDKLDSTMNLRDLMNQVTELIGGESGGHKFAAGCIINKDKEEAFIELVKKKLEFETIKI
jgi:nanoRNase/pAp phosphatase (c-di-AMP/oligoRNAs hydrolase)